MNFKDTLPKRTTLIESIFRNILYIFLHNRQFLLPLNTSLFTRVFGTRNYILPREKKVCQVVWMVNLILPTY
jgi:hypothetical protein